MRVFLAGATGFVGGAILRHVLAAGHDATVLVRNLSRFAAPPRVTVVQGDIGDNHAWIDVLGDCDAVVNAVGILRERGENTFHKVVVEGTRNLLEAAHRHGARRFIQVSANGIDTARFPYQTTKLEAEAMVKASDLDWTILRPSIVFGADDDFTNKFAKLMRLGVMPYFGDGRYELAPVWIEDLAEVATRSLSSDAARGRTFALCGPERVPYRDFLREVRAAAGRRALVVPAPRWSGVAMATLFGNMQWFPADRANLEMLFEGNTCPSIEWPQTFQIQPRPFRAGIRTYLGNGHAAPRA